VHQGKIRYFGSSTFPASQIVEAQWVAENVLGVASFLGDDFHADETGLEPYGLCARQALNPIPLVSAERVSRHVMLLTAHTPTT
jgi:aryl-alcohol dehydrogenase-like predicted oxidoreductase